MRQFDTCGPRVALRLGCGSAEVEWHRVGVFDVRYGAMLGFELFYIFLKRAHEAFCVLRRKDDARFHFGFGDAGHHLDKVDDELLIRMRDDGKIRVDTFCRFLTQFDVDLVFLRCVVVVRCHRFRLIAKVP